MDNLTHSLVGLAAAKAGLEKLSPGATTLCVLAANAPDADLVTLIYGRWTFLHHHRGITHSIVGAFVLAVALPIAFYLGDRIVALARKRAPVVQLPGLLLASMIATATHPLLDWANNYGVRFLLPWNPRWFYGDFVFIIDPFLWMVLGGAAFLLTSQTRKRVVGWSVLALVPSYVVLVAAAGSLNPRNEMLVRILWIAGLLAFVTFYRFGVGNLAKRRLAIAAIAVCLTYCGGLATAHALALHAARRHAANIAASHAEQVVQVVAMPTVANPAEWVCVMQTNRATYRFNISLLHGPLDSPKLVRFEFPQGASAEALTLAARDRRAQVFLGFARFPVIEVTGEDCMTQTLVQFADLRYTEPGKQRGTFALDVQVDCPAKLDEQH